MAQLKDLIVNGASQLIGDVYTSQIQISKLNASTTAGGATYGAGSAGQVLTSNGTNTYWGVELNGYDGSLATNGWKNLGGRTSGNRLTVSYNNAAATWNAGTYSASLLFGCNDTKGLLDIAHASPVVSFAGGSVGGTTDNGPKWYYKLSGTTGCTYTLPAATKTLAANDGSNATGTWTLNLKTNKVQAPTAAGGSTYGAGSSGQALMSNGSTVYWGSVSGTDEKVKYDKSTSNTAFKVLAGANGSPTNGTCTGSAIYCNDITLNPSNGVFRATKVYGAVYNDYAEYRQTNESIQPGRCIVENGDGTLSLSTKRLMRGCEIVSDTFGFAIGQTEKTQTPTAVCGRVLAYCLEGQEYAKNYIGWPVCSGPNGTVSIMTEEEEEKYPSRIIGTISEIPNYKKWGHDNTEIDGRIWIRVR